MRDTRERLRDILTSIAAIERYADRERKHLSKMNSYKRGFFGIFKSSVRQPVPCQKRFGGWRLKFPGPKSLVCATSWCMVTSR